MNQALAIETPDRFRSAARAECQEAHRRTNDLYWLSIEALLKAEHMIRIKEYQQLIEPLIKIKAGMMPVHGLSFTMAPDGTMGQITHHWSETQQKTIALIDEQIAYYAGQCGVGPACEPPSLERLMKLSASPAPRS